MEMICHNLDDLFPDMAVVDVMPFRVARNADLERDEEEAEGAADEDLADLLVVGRGRDLRPAGAAGAAVAVGDELGTRAGAHGTSPFSIRPTTRSWALSISLFWVLTNSSYSAGETTSTSVRIAA